MLFLRTNSILKTRRYSMRSAFCILKNGQTNMISVDEIKIGYVNENDIDSSYCPFCGAKAFLRHNNYKEWCFYGVHVEGCQIASINPDDKYKIIRVKDNVIIDLASMLHHIDKDPINYSESEQDSTDANTIEPKDVIDIDTGEVNGYEVMPLQNDFAGEIEHHITQRIASASGLYNYYLQNGKSDCDFGDNLRGEQVVINKVRMMEARANGISEDVKIIPMKKAVWKNLLHKESIVVPSDYVLLQDVYSRDYEKSIYFLVKIKNDKCNKDFQNKLFNKDQKFNQKKIGTLVVAANFKKINNKYYQLYMAEINTKCIAFKRISDD